MTTPNDNAQEVLASLSAMFDDEATTQDIDRLLSRDGVSMSRQLEGFHLIQQMLHTDPAIDVNLGNGLVSRVRAQLDLENQLEPLAAVIPKESTNVVALPLEEETQAAKATHPAWYGMFAGTAVAASVAFVLVLLGGNSLLTSETVEPNVAQLTTVDTELAATPLAELNNNTLQVDNLRLQNYLRQHAEQAAMTVGQGMMPMARVVSYPIKE